MIRPEGTAAQGGSMATAGRLASSASCLFMREAICRLLAVGGTSLHTAHGEQSTKNP